MRKRRRESGLRPAEGEKRLREGSGRPVIVGREDGESGKAVEEAKRGTDVISESISTRETIVKRLSSVKKLRGSLTIVSESHPSISDSICSYLLSTPIISLKDRFQADLGESFRISKQRESTLSQEIASLQQQLSEAVAARTAAQARYQAQESQQRAEFAQAEAELEERLKKSQRQVDKLASEVVNYRRLTGVDVSEPREEWFRCKVKVQRNELIIRAKNSEEGLDVETVSYTVPGERVPSYLKEELTVDKGEEPVLLQKLIACLI